MERGRGRRGAHEGRREGEGDGKIEGRGGSARTSIYWTIFVFAKLAKEIVHSPLATTLNSLARHTISKSSFMNVIRDVKTRCHCSTIIGGTLGDLTFWTDEGPTVVS